MNDEVDKYLNSFLESVFKNTKHEGSDSAENEEKDFSEDIKKFLASKNIVAKNSDKKFPIK